jgi:hypothetical protein
MLQAYCRRPASVNPGGHRGEERDPSDCPQNDRCAVIGGVVTSASLRLHVIPTVYDILVGWRDRIFDWFRRAPDAVPEPGHGD